MVVIQDNKMDFEAIGDQELGLDKPPKLGLKLLLNHKFPIKSKQIIIPRPKQMFEMMPLTAR